MEGSKQDSSIIQALSLYDGNWGSIEMDFRVSRTNRVSKKLSLPLSAEKKSKLEAIMPTLTTSPTFSLIFEPLLKPCVIVTVK